MRDDSKKNEGELPAKRAHRSEDTKADLESRIDSLRNPKRDALRAEASIMLFQRNDLRKMMVEYEDSTGKVAPPAATIGPSLFERFQAVGNAQPISAASSGAHGQDSSACHSDGQFNSAVTLSILMAEMNIIGI